MLFVVRLCLLCSAGRSLSAPSLSVEAISCDEIAQTVSQMPTHALIHKHGNAHTYAHIHMKNPKEKDFHRHTQGYLQEHAHFVCTPVSFAPCIFHYFATLLLFWGLSLEVFEVIFIKQCFVVHIFYENLKCIPVRFGRSPFNPGFLQKLRQKTTDACDILKITF